MLKFFKVLIELKVTLVSAWGFLSIEKVFDVVRGDNLIYSYEIFINRSQGEITSILTVASN